MKKLLEYLAKEILGKKVEVNEAKQEGFSIFTVRVPKEDMGKMIGKNGRIIRAVRTLAKTRAIVDKIAVAVKLEEV